METNLKDLGKTFQENGVNLPELNVTSVNVEKVEQVLREKCEKQGAGDVVDSIKDKQEEIKNCVTENINVTQVQEELEEAKKTGSMDVVFAKYCKKMAGNIRMC
ncbi:27 kDa hemolymph glycoprotein-like [Sitophilus oryzae]|uniref:27 kDa hemolymph glycoprotein-like n=1 Tax=Sitophilus oryzae TaxID=7048 RepID=A0A6J2YX23_SITOR|nr:27 kDa hemolymph glycoprotein-like [Sitophilus oryzae]